MIDRIWHSRWQDKRQIALICSTFLGHRSDGTDTEGDEFGEGLVRGVSVIIIQAAMVLSPDAQGDEGLPEVPRNLVLC